MKKKDFDNVWKSGRSAFGRFLGVKVTKNGLTENRFGITVGLKFSKKAVERNKIKRRLREILRRKYPNVNHGFDVAITVLPAARLSDFEDLKKEIEWCFRKLNMG